jgi:hypothetical protein
MFNMMSGLPLARRLFAMLFSVWFALFSLAPASLRSCPMHGNAAAGGVALETTATAMAGHEHHAPVSSDEPAPEPSHSCDCVTTCCGVPTMALPIAPASVAEAAERAVESAVSSPAPSHAPSRDRLLPFANGPPEPAGG